MFSFCSCRMKPKCSFMGEFLLLSDICYTSVKLSVFSDSSPVLLWGSSATGMLQLKFSLSKLDFLNGEFTWWESAVPYWHNSMCQDSDHCDFAWQGAYGKPIPRTQVAKLNLLSRTLAKILLANIWLYLGKVDYPRKILVLLVRSLAQFD